MPSNYAHAYKKSWESLPELKEWLEPMVGDKTKTYCVFCKCTITAKLSGLQTHNTAVKHVRDAEPF